VFAGVIAVVIIALVIDLILLLIGRALMPWTRAASKATASRAIAVGAPA
jgi:osmoprotectant transport system permease protein